MDRAMILDHLAQSREQVALGEKHIARQHEIISELDRDGHGTTEARALLVQFEEMQVEHVKHRDRLEKELRAKS